MIYGTHVTDTLERDRVAGAGHDEITTRVIVEVDGALVGPHDAPRAARQAAERAVEGAPLRARVVRGGYPGRPGVECYDVDVVSIAER